MVETFDEWVEKMQKKSLDDLQEEINSVWEYKKRAIKNEANRSDEQKAKRLEELKQKDQWLTEEVAKRREASLEKVAPPKPDEKVKPPVKP